MSAEVISMTEFNQSKNVSEMETISDEEFREDNEWAMTHSSDLVHLAGNTFRVVLLVHNLVEDTLLHCQELEGMDLEEIKAQLRCFVESGIKTFETRCPDCSGE